MAVATGVVPAIAQSAAPIPSGSDETEDEPPQHFPFETPDLRQSTRTTPRQETAQQATSNQSQRQFINKYAHACPDKLSDEHVCDAFDDSSDVRHHQESNKPAQPSSFSSSSSLSSSSVSSSVAFPPISTSALSSSPSPLSPPRQFPTADVEVHDTIPEESDETDCDTPDEPVTPVSGRQSRDSFPPAEPEPVPETERLVSELKTGSHAVAVPLTIPIPTRSLAHPHNTSRTHHGQNNHHNHHNHHNHNHRHPHPRHPHQQQHASGNGSVHGDTNGFCQVDCTASAPASDASKHSLPSLSTSSRTSIDGNPETPTTTRPTTAVAGSFLINPPNGYATSGSGIATDASSAITAVNSAATTEAPPSPSVTRRPSRTNSSTNSFKRTMSNLFRRSSSQNEKVAFGVPDYNNIASDTNLVTMAAGGGSHHRKTPSRRWSMHRSLATSQSNSPPSPGTPPLEMAFDQAAKHGPAGASASAVTAASSGPSADPSIGPSARPSADAAADTSTDDATAGAAESDSAASRARYQRTGLPTQDDFLQNDSKKHRQRASTGLSIHHAIHIVTGASNPLGNRRNKHKNKRGETRRRASSFEHASHNPPLELGGELWALPAEAGTGLKARRMSLSLPDDFTVDVCDLHAEFDYQHMLGRHRRHLGKGATSKVTLMFRKGFVDELYAVKEFRGKSSSETREEYEKKVKSEYSIAKSLHHPNIVETFRLCTDHGRWNHVMEYCQEGDLYSLVEKKYLTTAEREKDRQCLFKQLIQGLNYLHTHGIAHRDIKLENLLITNNCKLKITDFGASDIFSGVHPGLREAGGECGRRMDGLVRLSKPGICGSLPYISPEVLEAKTPYDPRKLDVWAAAVVMLHLIFGAPLWAEARIKANQPNPQYAALLRGWEKWNATHLAGKKEAEKQHAEKQQAAEAAEAAAAKERSDNQDEASKEPEANGSAGAAAAAAAPTSNGATSVPPTVAPTPASTALIPAVSAVPVHAESANSIVEGPYPTVAAFDAFVNPPVLRRILLQMLNPDPSRRATVAQVANLRWFRNIECCQQECYEDSMAAPKTTADAHPIDAAKRSTANFNGQKIYCHDHMPHKTHAHTLGRIG